MSTLHIIETKTGARCPTRLSARARQHCMDAGQLGILLHALSEEGRRADGQEMYNRHVFYHELGTDPATIRLKIFGRDAMRRTGRA
jgi:hypothetical protein